MNIFQEIIKTLLTKAAVRKLSKLSQQESYKEAEENPYQPNFSVYPAKWIIPLFIFFILAMVVILYEISKYDDMSIFAYILVSGLLLLGIYGFFSSLTFNITLDSREIKVTRLFRGTKFYSADDIISCTILNDNSVIVTVEFDTIKIDSFMVNAKRFANFARQQVYLNTAKQNKKYKVSRMIEEKILIIVYISIFTMFYFYLMFNSVKISMQYHIFIIALLCLCFFWLASTGLKILKVDESRKIIICRCFFHAKQIPFSEILDISSKSRFLEKNAVNYIFTYQDKNRKHKFKITSLDTNADRLISNFVECD